MDATTRNTHTRGPVVTQRKKQRATPSGPEGFAERFMTLKGERSFHELSRELGEAGFRITAQALHKWANGSIPDPDNVTKLAAFFGVPSGKLMFGEEANGIDGLSPAAVQLAQAWSLLPDRYKEATRREVLLLADTFRRPDLSEPEQAFYRQLESAIRQLKTA